MDKNIRNGIVFDIRQIPEDTDVLMGHMALKTIEKRFPEGPEGDNCSRARRAVDFPMALLPHLR